MADCADTSSDDGAAFRAALANDPFDAVALAGLGTSLLAGGRPGEAIALFEAAAELAPSAQAFCRVAVACQRAGLRQEAEARLAAALDVDADCIEALVLLGGLLRLEGRLAESEAALRRGIALAPADEELRMGLASTLVERGNAAYRGSAPEEAEALYRDALALLPTLAAAHTNLGNALAQQLRLPEAMDAYRAAVALDTDNHGAYFAMSLTILLQGDIEEGFRLFEHRRKMLSMAANFNRRPEIPVWQPGDSLAGKRVLVTAEQGAGDIFQTVRFVPALAQEAAAVVLDAPWTMTGVFDALPGVERVVALESAVADCDISVPLMSLPLLLGVGAGTAPPYLAPLEDRVWRWEAWLDRGSPGRRVGLVFAGNEQHPRDRERSVTLETYRPLIEAVDASFVVVQPWMSDADRDVMDDVDTVRFPGAALTDWADTAALLSLLDLVITVDTAAAHLAGALGRPVWTLLPYCPDWRWLLGRSDSPWYPSMRLYRQDRRGDWAPVIQRVREDLAAG